MNGSARPHPALARTLALAMAFPGSLLLTQCQTGAGKPIQVGRYTQATLRTPSGHGMERKEYPFDASGKYRIDWVKTNATGKDPSAHGSPSTGGGQLSSGIEVASARRGARGPDSPPESAATLVAASPGAAAAAEHPSGEGPPLAEPAYNGGAPSSLPPLQPATSAPLDAVPALAAAPAPAPEPAPSPRYHRVSSGDTLFALSRRYGTSVDELKRVNGMRGDTIHVGQSLRIP